MRTDPDEVKGALRNLIDNSPEEFLEFIKKAEKRGRAKHPEVVIMAYIMAETDSELGIMLIHYCNLRRAWERLLKQYETFLPRGECEAGNDSFVAEFIEKELRTRLDLMRHPWAHDESALVGYGIFLDQLFTKFSKIKVEEAV